MSLLQRCMCFVRESLFIQRVKWSHMRIFLLLHNEKIRSQYITSESILGNAEKHINQFDKNLHTFSGSWRDLATHTVSWFKAGQVFQDGVWGALSKINHDIKPRGLRSFMKTCHRWTFTHYFKVSGFRIKKYTPHDPCSYFFFFHTSCSQSLELPKPTFREKL